MPDTADWFEIVDCAQGSDEWLEARAGRVTGSCAHVVMMKNLPSGGEPAGKKDYRLKLAVERITGKPQLDDFTNAHIRRGKEQEAMARTMVEVKYGLAFRETGFLRHKRIACGVSLDGDSHNFDTITELKCPKSTTHLGYLKGGVVPAAYRWQIVHGLYVSGARRCIFGSFDDRMPSGLQLFTTEVFAISMPIQEYEAALIEFLKSVDKLEGELRLLQESKK